MKSLLGFFFLVFVCFAQSSHAYWRTGYGYPSYHSSTALEGHLRGLATLRLSTAQAYYWKAKADGEAAKARLLHDFVKTLENEQRRIDAAQWDLKLQLESLRRKSRSLNALKAGKISAGAMQALFYFESLPGFYDMPSIKNIKGKIGPFGVSNFEARHAYRDRFVDGKAYKEEVIVEPFKGGNFLMFVQWLRNKPYNLVLKTGGTKQSAWEFLLSVSREIQLLVSGSEESLIADQSAALEQTKALWGDAIWGAQGSLPDHQEEWNSLQ